MEIHLHQREDGSFFLEVKHKGSRKEVDVTDVLREIVVDRIRLLQEKLNLEEKYRNWILESAQESTRTLSVIATRYETVSQRLKETNQAISRVISEWQKGQAIAKPLGQLESVRLQNEHFLENDSTMKKLPKS